MISFMGYFKLVISFLKYLPQFYWNYKRKSTVGWSIMNIMLDFTGGLFSFVQMALERINGPIEINAVKLALSILVMFYDVLFMIQHYCLYRKPPLVQPIIYEKGSEVGVSFADETGRGSEPLISKTETPT